MSEKEPAPWKKNEKDEYELVVEHIKKVVKECISESTSEEEAMYREVLSSIGLPRYDNFMHRILIALSYKTGKKKRDIERDIKSLINPEKPEEIEKIQEHFFKVLKKYLGEVRNKTLKWNRFVTEIESKGIISEDIAERLIFQKN